MSCQGAPGALVIQLASEQEPLMSPQLQHAVRNVQDRFCLFLSSPVLVCAQTQRVMC